MASSRRASTSPTTWHRWLLAAAAVAGLLHAATAAATHRDAQQILQLDASSASRDVAPPIDQPPPVDPLREMIDALDVLENEYFAVWEGIWPTSIDWTSAVIGTHLSAALSTLSIFFEYSTLSTTTLAGSAKAQENLIDRYFSQLTASYFGQDAFSLRNEAYDDMLWVVLGWLETIQLVKMHDAMHYEGPSPDLTVHERYYNTSAWHGAQWIPAFAHRARIFWDLASQGWDTKLCKGGMIWSPHLVPYKNAITNELFISASIAMYLHFPGDDNTAPFQVGARDEPVPPHDPKYLAAAIEGYRWLSQSNMTDRMGLFVDGYHVRGWSSDGNTNTKCDDRNEMVYTYNQGVILSGQRGLWEATGARSYLEDGHELIANVIAATGYNLTHDRAADKHRSHRLGKWHGLGRMGIMEEACDSSGTCSQDAQTFKGIFFHHLTVFCRPLPLLILHPGRAPLTAPIDLPDRAQLRQWHHAQCARYRSWLARNAAAAVTTKDAHGRFGTWWGAANHSAADIPAVPLPARAIDYRNRGVPRDRQWTRMPGPVRPDWGVPAPDARRVRADSEPRRHDLNDRGRGRTVETQSGGLAVLRALQEMVVMQDAP